MHAFWIGHCEPIRRTNPTLSVPPSLSQPTRLVAHYPRSKIMATQHDVDNKFSNINGAYEATNAKLEELGKMDAKGQVSRVQFLSDVADAYVAGTLNYVTPDKPKAKVSETHHAKHAWNVWNNARAK